MAKLIPTVLLNDLQLATLKELNKNAVDGVMLGTFAASFKQNVIGALVRQGAIAPYRGKHYRATNAVIARRPDHVARTPKTVVANDVTDVTAVAA